MEDRSKLVENLDRFATALHGGLSRAERDHGWTDDLRRSYLNSLERLRTRYLDPAPLTERERIPNLARGLDTCGVVGGALLELAAQADVALLRLARDAYGDDVLGE